MKNIPEEVKACLLILAHAIQDGRIEGIAREIEQILYPQPCPHKELCKPAKDDGTEGDFVCCECGEKVKKANN